jgi:hypothetical protein
MKYKVKNYRYGAPIGTIVELEGEVKSRYLELVEEVEKVKTKPKVKKQETINEE